MKTVVLVNGGSASASEILSGALSENLGFKLIGDKTFGKGTIQEPLQLEKGCFTPHHNCKMVNTKK